MIVARSGQRRPGRQLPTVSKHFLCQVRAPTDRVWHLLNLLLFKEAQSEVLKM